MTPPWFQPDAYPFPMWIVFQHPLDFPTGYAAKLFFITREGDTIPSESPDDFITAPRLVSLRQRLADDMGVTRRFERLPDDLPQIIESWV